MFEEVLKRIVTTGEGVSREEAERISEEASTEELLSAAEIVTKKFLPVRFDSCSIINAKSGRCPENCKWCAQSAHYHTGAAEYPLLGREKMAAAAVMCHERGIGRFSFVMSGRRLNDAEVDEVCRCCDEIRSKCNISLCMSAGLLELSQLEKLHAHGVSRYHCNLETAPSFFGTLCTTHDQNQKIATLKAAREAGMDICTGGIIGMGESARQRIELAFALKELGAGSVPVNVLSPIKGTPLESQSLLGDDELFRTVALFRLILPKAYLRFAGGIARFSDDTIVRAYRAGINSAIMGDMLTTAGTDISSNVNLIRRAGYEF